MKTRKPFVGGNWKSNGTLSSVAELVKGLNRLSPPQHVDVLVVPSYLHIPFVFRELKRTYLVGAQDVSKFPSGPYTGDISAEMLRDFGLNWVVIGHSERRIFHSNTDEVVSRKIKCAQTCGMNVVVCIGETLPQRQKQQTFDVLNTQMTAAAQNVIDWRGIVIAYEPVWAIGTGLAASPQEAQEVHAFIRQWISKNVSADVAEHIRIVYGGSVKVDNSVMLANQKDIDGFLVGGDALKAQSFIDICHAMNTSKYVSTQNKSVPIDKTNVGIETATTLQSRL